MSRGAGVSYMVLQIRVNTNKRAAPIYVPHYAAHHLFVCGLLWHGNRIESLISMAYTGWFLIFIPTMNRHSTIGRRHGDRDYIKDAARSLVNSGRTASRQTRLGRLSFFHDANLFFEHHYTSKTLDNNTRIVHGLRFKVVTMPAESRDWVIRIPRSDSANEFVLVYIAPGKAALDLKFIATEGENPYVGSCMYASAANWTCSNALTEI